MNIKTSLAGPVPASVVVLTGCLVVSLASPLRADPELTDTNITDKVDDELLFDPGVRTSQIDATATDGVVTLTGQVTNILAKERAAKVAETVKGVRSVVNRIEVEPPSGRSDQKLQQDVEAALLQDPATESYEITPQVSDGTVSLMGTVESYQERELVKTVVKGVRGVTDIRDQLSVNYKSNRPDVEIQNEVEKALHWNTHVDGQLIDVNVDAGRVVLLGVVGSAAEKRMAEKDCWVAGVQSINSSGLKVAEWARDEKMRVNKYVTKSPSEVEQAVNDALLYDPRVASFNVDVSVAGSVVTLRGDVDNLKAKRAAEQDARNTVGVSSVNSRLKVRYEGDSTIEEIEGDIRSALFRDPYIERLEITTEMLGGTAYLYGSVDSYFERNRAEDIVSRVPGVLDVQNQLDVGYGSDYIYNPYVDDLYFDNKTSRYQPRASLTSDSELKESIEAEMWWSPFVDSDEVDVAVDDGVATLTGTVDTWGEYRSATENAYEGGATLVDNDLSVDYQL